MIRFIELFQVTIDDFHWLSNSLRKELQEDPRERGEPLTVEAQAAVGLYCLGHSSSYLTIGHVFNIGKETTDKAASQFVLAVLKVLRLCTIRCKLAHKSYLLASKLTFSQYSSYPALDSLDQWASIRESFEKRNGMPGIVGAIDGTHIPLSMPPCNQWKGYINRKSWASIVFQCVVNGDGNFRNLSLFPTAASIAFSLCALT
jgi:hypothetical protein